MKKRTTDELQRLSIDGFRNAEKFPVSIVLDNLRSMNNVGSFFRTCDAFRISRLYLCGYTPCPPHREITKSALGSELSVGWQHEADTCLLVEQLKKQGHKVWAIEQADGSISLENFQTVRNEPLCLVFGNEVSGIDDKVMELVDGCVEIPQFGTKHSLNVSVSAGIVLWHVIQEYLTKK